MAGEAGRHAHRQILSATVVTATVFGGVPAAQASVVINKKPAPSFDTTIKKAARPIAVRAQADQIDLGIHRCGGERQDGVESDVRPGQPAGKTIADDPVRGRIGEQGGHHDGGDAVGGPGQGLAGRSGDALRAGFRDAVAAVQSRSPCGCCSTIQQDCRARTTPTPGATNRSPRTSIAPWPGCATRPEDDAGCDECVLQRLLHAGRSGGGSGSPACSSRTT